MPLRERVLLVRVPFQVIRIAFVIVIENANVVTFVQQWAQFNVFFFFSFVSLMLFTFGELRRAIFGSSRCWDPARCYCLARWLVKRIELVGFEVLVKGLTWIRGDTMISSLLEPPTPDNPIAPAPTSHHHFQIAKSQHQSSTSMHWQTNNYLSCDVCPWLPNKSPNWLIHLYKSFGQQQTKEPNPNVHFKIDKR